MGEGGALEREKASKNYNKDQGFTVNEVKVKHEQVPHLKEKTSRNEAWMTGDRNIAHNCSLDQEYPLWF